MLSTGVRFAVLRDHEVAALRYCDVAAWKRNSRLSSLSCCSESWPGHETFL